MSRDVARFNCRKAFIDNSNISPTYKIPKEFKPQLLNPRAQATPVQTLPTPPPPHPQNSALHSRHHANRQHLQHSAHAPARHHRPDEQIVRDRGIRTELQDRVHAVRARQGAAGHAADDGGVAAFDVGGRTKEKELEAGSGGMG